MLRAPVEGKGVGGRRSVRVKRKKERKVRVKVEVSFCKWR